MLRQIEEQRVEKYKEIEKIKEKHNNKVAHLREKFGMAQIEYEKNLKMMNMCIEDLKLQNMDLQKELSDISERKGGNYMAERKNSRDCRCTCG